MLKFPSISREAIFFAPEIQLKKEIDSKLKYIIMLNASFMFLVKKPMEVPISFFHILKKGSAKANIRHFVVLLAQDIFQVEKLH